MRCHPARWLWGLIPVAMLSWLAVQVERSSIQSDLEQRSAAALAAAGHDWAVVAFDGRDGLLAGQPDSEHQREEAVALVSGVWGVRVVRTRTDSPAMPQFPPLERTLDDQSPEAVVSDLAPDDAAHVPAEAAQSLAAASSETLRTGGEPGGPSVPTSEEAGASALPTVPTREASLSPSSVPAAETAPPPAGAAVSQPPAPAANAASEGAPEIPVPKAPALSDPATGQAATQPPAKTEQETAPTVAAQMQLPTQKPAAEPSALRPPEAAAAPAAESAAPPAKAEAEATRLAARAELPERKPASVTPAIEPPATPLAEAATAKHTPGPMTSAFPARRFETAALPPGNIAPAGACLGDVRAAAQRVEVHFARGDARFDPPGKSLIDGLIAALKACPEAVLRVAGHADATGKTRHNQVLSRHRARGVASYMANKGIDAGRLVAIGYGDKRPVAPNDTKANRARNRRIELTVTARAAPLPPMPIRKQGTRNGLSHR